MGYPTRVPAFIEGRPGKKRAHATAKGTPRKPLPSVGTPGPHRPKSWQKILSNNARTFRRFSK